MPVCAHHVLTALFALSLVTLAEDQNTKKGVVVLEA